MYRTSEGAGNLSENYKTFEACLKIFKENALYIFSVKANASMNGICAR
jgi:hypothetical protein